MMAVLLMACAALLAGCSVISAAAAHQQCLLDAENQPDERRRGGREHLPRPGRGRGRRVVDCIGGLHGARLSDRTFIKGLLSREDDGPYITHLRMRRHTFRMLVARLEPHPVFRTCAGGGFFKPQAPVEEQVLATVYYFANGGTLVQNTMALGLGTGTLWAYIGRVTEALRDLRCELIKFPSTVEDMESSAQEFESLHKIPNCIGIVDGTRIRVRNRGDDNAQFLNMHYGTNIAGLVMCSARGLITYASFGYPGRMHDSPCLERSEIFQKRKDMVQNRKFILADAGFSLTPWCMTPFKDCDIEENLTRANFNKFFCGRRCLIERVIGHLKGRFSIIAGTSTLRDITKLVDYSLACCVLYNFCLLHNDLAEGVFEEAEAEVIPLVDIQAAGGVDPDSVAVAKQVREALITLFNLPQYIALRKTLRNARITLV